MTVERSHHETEINCSIGNLFDKRFDKSTLLTAMWPVGTFVDTAQKSGYKGLEWHPLRGIAAGIQMSAGLLSQHSKESIRSLHQSFRSEKNLSEAWKHPNRTIALASYVLFPERVSSLNDLERLQKMVGRELPIVLYPENPGEESGTDRHFAEKTIQPTPEVMNKWGVKTTTELMDEAYKRGYTGVCTDLYHMRAKAVNEISLNPWQETLPQLLPHTQEIHVSAGRVDIKQSHIDTEKELIDLLNSKENSEIQEMLRMVKESGWTGRVVTEIPAIALHSIRKGKSSSYSTKNLIEDHRRIVDNIRNILA